MNRGRRDAELLRVVRLNEAIKAVSEASRQVYTIALNAMFAARQSQVRVPGFNRVTEELRVFSQRLDRSVAEVGGSLGQMVRVGAELAKQNRRGRHFERADAGCRRQGASPALLAGVLADQRSRQGTFARLLENLRHAVLEALGRALRLCGIGEQLAVLCKVEAQAGGANSELDAVAVRLQQAIAEILIRLNGARALLNH
ncbi:MAG: hypothetical protein AB1332_03800 [Pseudomonadota bacterium]|jgi:hypothetical protein